MATVGEETAGDRLALLDWKRRIFGLYAQVRAAEDPERAWERWRSERDELFATHPQSPLPLAARAGFAGLEYFPYDSSLRVDAEVVPTPLVRRQIGSSGPEPIAAERFAEARFSPGDAVRSLELYWIGGYGGGLFLAFRDATSGSTSYGGGRYLLDTVKGSDLGSSDGRLLLDFNFAYNPSCCYDPRWTCPLAPPANRLAASMCAGERMPGSRQ
jgi:uncharacterized protein